MKYLEGVVGSMVDGHVVIIVDILWYATFILLASIKPKDIRSQ